MAFAWVGLMVAAGLGLAVQAAANARLREGVQSPALSALLSFVIGGVVLAVLTASGVMGRGRLSGLNALPAWAWLGGVFGAIYVCAAVVTVPRIGTALVIAGAVFGQMVAALALDSFGWFGVPRIPLSPWRVVGAILLLVGVILMQRK